MIFNQSLTTLIHGPKTTVAQRVRRSAATSGHLLRPTPIHREATQRATCLLAWHRLIITDGGYLGLAPTDAQAKDVIAVLEGCNVPLVLRPAKETQGQFAVVGECYIHGIMSGEMVEFLEQGRYEVVDITLC